jgi:hypothetical protein
MSLDTEVLSRASAVAVIGIRYGLYLVGVLVLGGVALAMLLAWQGRARVLDAPPAFRLTAATLAQLPASGHVVTSARFGRIEVRQHGRLSNRGVDLALIAVMPPRGLVMGTELAQDLRDVNLLRSVRAVMLPVHHDLVTRYGEFRAIEMRVDADGRWKQCLAFRSRLETTAIYFTGWHCDGSGAKPAAQLLACMLDTLSLDAFLASREADQHLRARLLRAPLCSAERVTQTTDIRQRRSSSPARWSQPNAQRR